MRLAIIGCGSLGLLLAAKISASSIEPVLVCRRPEQVEAIASTGVRVYGEGGEAVAKVKAVHVSTVQRGGFDIAVIAVKAYDTAAAAEAAKTLLKRGGSIVTVQNGLGPLEYLEKTMKPYYNVYGAAVYIGARRLSDYEVEYAGGSTIIVGPRGDGDGEETITRFIDALREAGLDAKYVTDIEPWRWDKLAVNAAINPITALLGVPNGAIARSKPLMGLAENLAREVELVAKAEGVKLPRDPVTAVRETVEKTGSNKSSMLQDIEARRPTEIEYINGAVVRLAIKHGIHVPYNEALYLLVKGLEDLYEIERHGEDLLEYLWRLET